MRMIVGFLITVFLASTLMTSVTVYASEANANDGDSTKILTAEEKREQELEKRRDRENWREERRKRMIMQYEPSGKGDYKKINEYIKQYSYNFNYDPRLWHFEVTAEMEKGIVYLKGDVLLEQMKQGIIDLLKLLGFEKIIADDVMVLPDPALREHVWGIVSATTLNQYADYSDKERIDEESNLRNILTYGAAVQILKKSEDKEYTLIQSPEGYLGWAPADGIMDISQEKWQQFKLGPFAFINEPVAVNPETGGWKTFDSDKEILAEGMFVIPKGSVQLLNDRGEIVLADDKTLAVDKSLYMFQDPSRDPRREEIVAIAKSFTGTPYVWGGVSDQGIDCSGFTQAAYRGVGIPLARDASQQVIGGEIVGSCATMAAALPGDLIYFGGRNGRISHTGLYLGNGRFIHASGEPGVAENSFNPADPDYDHYLHNRVVWIRRFIR